MRPLLFLASLLFIGASADAAETETREFVPEWGVTIVHTVSAPNASDFIRESLRILSANGAVIGKIRNIVGPVLKSLPNRQLVACEGNGIDQGGEVLVFGLDGGVYARSSHLGFMRSCGLTTDQRYYWFRYDNMDSGKPFSIVVVLDSVGTVLVNQRLDHAGTVTFDALGNSYELKFDEPQIPG